jgi:hypothetical protein
MRFVLRGLIIWVFVLGAKAVAVEGTPSMLDAGPLKIFYDVPAAQREVCDSILSSVSWTVKGTYQYFDVETEPVVLKPVHLREGTAGESLFVYDTDVFGDGDYTSVFLFEQQTYKIFDHVFYAVNENIKSFLMEEMKFKADIRPSLEKNFVNLFKDVKDYTRFYGAIIEIDQSGRSERYYKTVSISLIEKSKRLYIIKNYDKNSGNPNISINIVEKNGNLRLICAFYSKFGIESAYVSDKTEKHKCPYYKIEGRDVFFPALKYAEEIGYSEKIKTKMKKYFTNNWIVYSIKNSEYLIIVEEIPGSIKSTRRFSTISKNDFALLENQEWFRSTEESTSLFPYDVYKNNVEASVVLESDERTYLIFDDRGPRFRGDEPEEGVTVYTVNGEEIDYVCRFSIAITPPMGVTIRP